MLNDRILKEAENLLESKYSLTSNGFLVSDFISKSTRYRATLSLENHGYPYSDYLSFNITIPNYTIYTASLSLYHDSVNDIESFLEKSGKIIESVKYVGGKIEEEIIFRDIKNNSDNEIYMIFREKKKTSLMCEIAIDIESKKIRSAYIVKSDYSKRKSFDGEDLDIAKIFKERKENLKEVI